MTPVTLSTILFKKWPTLLLVPLINATCVVIFWQSQLWQYNQSTTGVLFMWLVAGLLFVVLQLSLQFQAWRQLRATSSPAAIEGLWSLGVQIVLFLVAAVYNCIALVQLLLLGVYPQSLFDGIIVAILLATAVAGGVLYRHRLGSPEARLLYATGAKAVPQWLQAVWLALQGSVGMHPATIGALVIMGSTRFILTRHAARQVASAPTIAAHKAAFRDVASIGGMAVGWLIGRL